MKVLVVGASRGTGAALVDELVQRGHLVTAYARHAGDDDAGCDRSPPTCSTRSRSARR